jgi:hypothetical protein
MVPVGAGRQGARAYALLVGDQRGAMVVLFEELKIIR